MATKTSTTKTSTRRASKPAPKMDDVMTKVPRELIAKRAFELFIEGGGKHGHHVEHWLRAERELSHAVASS